MGPREHGRPHVHPRPAVRRLRTVAAELKFRPTTAAALTGLPCASLLESLVLKLRLMVGGDHDAQYRERGVAPRHRLDFPLNLFVHEIRIVPHLDLDGQESGFRRVLAKQLDGLPSRS